MSAWVPDPLAACGFRWDRAAEPAGREPATTMWSVASDEPVAVTAGEQDHSDPWRFAGDEAAAPVNT